MTNIDRQTYQSGDSTRAQASTRLDWVDVAKGLGIIFVVIGHVLGGIIGSDLALGAWPVREFFLVLYIFHMPLFFLLSGLFVVKRLELNPKRFVRTIGRNLYYPYLLWSFIQYTLIYFAGKWTNIPPAPYLETILYIPIVPVAQFWFLLSLAGMQLAAYLLVPKIGVRALVLLGLVLRSVAMIFDPAWIVLLSFDFFFFYALGVALGPQGVEDLVRPRLRARAVIATIAAVGFLIMTAQVIIMQAPPAYFYREAPRLASAILAQIGWAPIALGAALAMIAVVIVWAANARGAIKTVLLYLGRLSLPIYILHVMCIAGVRIFAIRFFGLTNIGILLSLLTIVGILGPIVMHIVLVRLKLARTLGLA